MKRDKVFEGINSVMTTQFTKSGELDLEATQRHAEYFARAGVSAVILTGSVGECANMTDAERVQVWQAVRDVVKQELYVIGATNHTSTRSAIALAQEAEQLGLDGIMNLSPYYWPSARGEHLRHYEALTKATELPILLYNNPGVTQDCLSPSFLRELSDMDHITAIKQTGSLVIMEDMLRIAGDKIMILNGEGELYEPFPTIMGCPGVCSALSNFLAPITVEIYALAKAGKYEESMALRRELVNPITDYIFNPEIMSTWQAVAAYKHIEFKMGYSNGAMRPPAYALEPQHKEAVDRILIETGLLKRNAV